MKKRSVKKISVLLIALCIAFVLSSCMRTETNLELKRSGSGTITAEVLMTDEAVTDIYGMPTNFYDAVEKDGRFQKVLDWNKEYVEIEKDGVNYRGVRLSKTVSKKDIQGALSALYGQYADVTYEDKGAFGNRTVTVKFNGISHLMTDELQGALDGKLISHLTITTPASVSSTNANKIADNKVELDLTGILSGQEPSVSYEIKFFDFTFYIPIGAIAVVVIAAAVFFLVRFGKNKKQNEGLTSINLKNIKKKKPASGGFGSSGSAEDDLGNYQPKAKMSFTKKTPKYTSQPESPTAESTPAPSVPAPAPVTPTPAPVTPAPTQSSTIFTPRSTAPVNTGFTPRQEAPAEPAYTEPAYTEPAYTEPAPVASAGIFSTGSTQTGGTASSRMSSNTEASATPVYTSGAETSDFIIGRSHGEENVDYSVAGSAKFNKNDRSSTPLSTGSTLFTPRSTAPNLAYGTSEYTEFERSEHEPTEHLHAGSTLFTPRSTAPNLGYGTAEFAEESRREHDQEFVHEELSTGSTMFTPRSTAANLDYGKEHTSFREEEKHVPDENITSLFTPRSTAPNFNYGLKEPLLEEEEVVPVSEARSVFYHEDKKYTAAADVAREYEQPAYEEPAYQEPAYEEPAYEQSYGQPAYGETYTEPAYEETYNQPYEQTAYEESYEQSAYEETYDQTGYEQSSYDQSGYGQSYEQSGYADSAYTQSSQGASIYQTSGYDSSPYQSANYGASEKSEAISGAYGGSKLGSGAYMGGGSTGVKIGRSVGNIGGYVDETSVNTSSYGSDPFANNTPLPKLGESGADGGGMFSIGSTGGFGTSAYEGNTIGGGSFGGGTFGGSKYQPAESHTSPISSVSQLETHTEHPNFGKTFHTGGSGKFDFGMAGSESKRKCPFCKEPIRDDDVFCVACGAELSRPYGSF